MYPIPVMVQDRFLRYYRLLLPHEPRPTSRLKPLSFSDAYFAGQFVFGLRLDDEQWLRLLAHAGHPPDRHLDGARLRHAAASLLARSATSTAIIDVHPLPHLDDHGRPPAYPRIDGPAGARYHLVPASLLLTHEPPGDVLFFDHASNLAEPFLDGLQLSNDQWADLTVALPHRWNVPTRGQPAVQRRYLLAAMGRGEIVAIREIPASSAPSSRPPLTEPATGPGTRPMTLGPHDGLHNQDWSAVSVKSGSFKTVKQVDMDNLAAADKQAKYALLDQGWDARKIKEILNSGEAFEIKELQPGDKLYAFDTQGREKNIQKSAYWLDDAGYKDVQARFYKNGQWDREGVKNYLSLPCHNRATDVSIVKITQRTTVLESKIAKARELVQYTDRSGYTTGMIGKIMGGGGKQITANPTVVAKG